MSGRIVFHIGFQKTGTTWIQRTLAGNPRPVGKRVGLAMRGPDTRALQVACLRWIAEPGDGTMAEVRAEAAAMGARLRAMPQPVALLSDETLVGRNIAGPTGDMVQWAEALLPEICAALAPELTDVVCYTREPGAWFASVHNQAVKIRRETRGLDEFVAAMPFHPGWDAITARIAAAVAPVPLTVVAMEEDAASPGGLGAALFAMLGLGSVTGRLKTPAAPANPSLPPAALELMLALNRSDLDGATLAQVRPLVLGNRDAIEKPRAKDG